MYSKYYLFNIEYVESNFHIRYTLNIETFYIINHWTFCQISRSWLGSIGRLLTIFVGFGLMCNALFSYICQISYSLLKNYVLYTIQYILRMYSNAYPLKANIHILTLQQEGLHAHSTLSIGNLISQIIVFMLKNTFLDVRNDNQNVISSRKT